MPDTPPASAAPDALAAVVAELRASVARLSSALVASAHQHALLRDVFRRSLADLASGLGAAAADADGRLAFERLRGEWEAVARAAEGRLDAGRVEWVGLGVPGPHRLTSQPCTYEQMLRPEFRRWHEQMNLQHAPHRKLWEYCYIAEALHERGMLAPGKSGLGFAVGSEPLPALFAAHGCEVLATDLGTNDAVSTMWAASDQHASSLDKLNDRGLCPPDAFNRLVKFRPVDMNALPPDLGKFDFCWSSCSFEHLGSLEHGKRFLENMAAHLKPGGVAVHTTEFNVFSDDATLEDPHNVIFRRRDIEEIGARLRAVGCTLATPNYFTGDTETDLFVDKPPYDQKVHLKLELGGYVSTSIGLVIRKDAAGQPA